MSIHATFLKHASLLLGSRFSTPRTAILPRVCSKQYTTTKPIKKYYFLSGLHDAVSEHLRPFNLHTIKFHDKPFPESYKLQWYPTNIVGHFDCSTESCKLKGWKSKKIAITIRYYPAGRLYNTTAYNQRCKRCLKRGVMHLNDMVYMDRVCYRLKKWNGIAVEPPPYNDEVTDEHREDLCEGCRMGQCAAAKKRTMRSGH